MAGDQVTLPKLISNFKETKFQIVYEKIIAAEIDLALSENDKYLLLKTGIIFLNYGDAHIAKLGYRIILRYSNILKDYIPLYDVAIAKDYIPIAKFIEKNFLEKELTENRFNNLFLSAFSENFKQVIHLEVKYL